MIGEMLNQSKSVAEVVVQLSKNDDRMTCPSGRNVIINNCRNYRRNAESIKKRFRGSSPTFEKL